MRWKSTLRVIRRRPRTAHSEALSTPRPTTVIANAVTPLAKTADLRSEKSIPIAHQFARLLSRTVNSQLRVRSRLFHFEPYKVTLTILNFDTRTPFQRPTAQEHTHAQAHARRRMPQLFIGSLCSSEHGNAENKLLYPVLTTLI